MASVLYAEAIPPLGGDTLWIDMACAWERLPERIRELLTGKIAVHTGAPYGVAHAPAEDAKFKGSIEIERNNPEADHETRHPAVCRHPVGRRPGRSASRHERNERHLPSRGRRAA